MTVITSLQAQGGIKETNPFPSGGEGGDFSLLEINTSISSKQDPNTDFISLLKPKYSWVMTETKRGSFHPMRTL